MCQYCRSMWIKERNDRIDTDGLCVIFKMFFFLIWPKTTSLDLLASKRKAGQMQIKLIYSNHSMLFKRISMFTVLVTHTHDQTQSIVMTNSLRPNSSLHRQVFFRQTVWMFSSIFNMCLTIFTEFQLLLKSRKKWNKFFIWQLDFRMALHYTDPIHLQRKKSIWKTEITYILS